MAERCGREPGTAPYITRSGRLPLGSSSAKAQPSCPQTLTCTSTNEELLILSALGRARADRALNE
eukprot:6407188-Pyramimonas_sp.AAC.1